MFFGAFADLRSSFVKYFTRRAKNMATQKSTQPTSYAFAKFRRSNIVAHRMELFHAVRTKAARQLQSGIVRSRFFAFSVLFHLLLIATFGTRKFLKKYA